MDQVGRRRREGWEGGRVGGLTMTSCCVRSPACPPCEVAVPGGEAGPASVAARSGVARPVEREDRGTAESWRSEAGNLLRHCWTCPASSSWPPPCWSGWENSPASVLATSQAPRWWTDWVSSHEVLQGKSDPTWSSAGWAGSAAGWVDSSAAAAGSGCGSPARPPLWGWSRPRGRSRPGQDCQALPAPSCKHQSDSGENHPTYLCIVSTMSLLVWDSWGWSYSVYFSKTLSMSVEAYWNN